METRTKRRASSSESTPDAFHLEEFKLFTSEIFEIDKRIAQVFGVAVAASVSLLTWAATYTVGHEDASLAFAYLVLAANLITLPSFFYLLAQRRDLVGFAAYVRFLERRLGVAGFQTGLGDGPGSVRSTKQRGGESNDPVPYTFWAIFIISAALFIYGIVQRGGSWLHLLFLVMPLGMLAYCHREWLRLIPAVLPVLTQRWMDRDAALRDRPE